VYGLGLVLEKPNTLPPASSVQTRTGAREAKHLPPASGVQTRTGVRVVFLSQFQFCD